MRLSGPGGIITQPLLWLAASPGWTHPRVGAGDGPSTSTTPPPPGRRGGDTRPMERQHRHTASGRPAVASPPPRCTHGHSSATVTQTSSSDTCTGGTRGQHIRHTCRSAEQRSAWLPCRAATISRRPCSAGKRKSIHLNASNDTL